jgi:acyl-CoA thioester hydrolase
MTENTLNIRVPYADVDRMGVVYYANYLIYFERGRTELLRQFNIPYRELEEEGIMLPVIESHCTYLKPAVYDDNLTIVSRIAEAKAARIKIQCEIYRNNDLLVTGYTWHACMKTDGKPCRLPERLKTLVADGG